MSIVIKYLTNFYYCTNPKCANHRDPAKNFYESFGYYRVKKSECPQKRMRCKTCGKTFSETAFSLHYRHRQTEKIFQYIFETSTQGLSNRSIARNLKLSETNIRNKLKHLMRQALLQWELRAKELKIKEAVAYDGFETFVYGQNYPNNINHAVGKESLYLYDFNYSHLNRKGRTTARQKKILREQVTREGRFPTNRTRVQTTKIFQRLNGLKVDSRSTLELYTDEHKSYQLSLEKDLINVKFKHYTVSSKRARNSANPLFPVNHLDIKLRHFLKNCTWETVAFNKNEAGLIDRLVLFAIVKNFFRSKFIKGRKNENTHSPAMLVGIAEKIYNFEEFFFKRLTSIHVKLRDEWFSYYKRAIECSKFTVVAYNGI